MLGFPGFYFRVSRPGRTLLGPGKLCLGLDGCYAWASSEPVVPFPAFTVSERLECDVDLPMEEVRVWEDPCRCDIYSVGCDPGLQQELTVGRRSKSLETGTYDVCP